MKKIKKNENENQEEENIDSDEDLIYQKKNLQFQILFIKRINMMSASR